MNVNETLSFIITYLKEKKEISDLEKSILDTFNEINKNPFDRQSAERQIIENNLNYQIIFNPIPVATNVKLQPLPTLTDDEIKYNLNYHLGFLIRKEVEVLNNGKNEI